MNYTKKILIINGANLNLLGIREPEIYGTTSFDTFFQTLTKKFPQFDLYYFQSNSEGAIIDQIHKAAQQNFHGIIINPGAYSHYSYAIYDAIKSIQIPVIEVHISNIFNRENFRQKSVTAAACTGTISGFGLKSYELALFYFLDS